MAMKDIDLDKLQKNILVRQITINDFNQIRELALKSFPGMIPWGKEQIESQLQIFPEGQLCVEYEGQIIGSSGSLIIDFDEYGEKHSWKDISDSGYITNHDPEGDTLYGIEVMVDPDYRGMKIGRRLYEARKKLVTELNLKRIVIGGRVPNYHKYADQIEIYEYVERVKAKQIYDPVLTFQLANDFNLKRIITDYMQSDSESQGFAMLLEWVNWRYNPKPTHRTLFSLPVRVCAVQYHMRKINSFDDFAQQCEYFVDIASGYKSDFAVFPEIFTLQLLSFLPRERPGKAVRTLASLTKQYLDLFQGLAIKYNINIIGGSHYTEENDDIYNIAYLFKRDGAIEKQYKLHITPNEQRWWGVKPGNKLEVFNTDRGKISIQICYDVEFPELGRIATNRGAQLFFVPFCTDERHGYLRVRCCAQARAIENQVFVVMAGCVGNLPFVDNIDINYAQSGIFTPSDFPFSREGIAGECQANIETVVIADVDLDLLKRNRQDGTVRNWLDRRKDLYEIVEKAG